MDIPSQKAASSAVAAEKARARKAAKATLAAITPVARASLSTRAAGIVAALSAYGSAGLVLAFLSMPTEIDTGPVIEAALAEGKRVAVPRIDGDDIAFIELAADWRSWPRDRWDIPEPPASIQALALKDIARLPTLALVPGLAFDSSGGRLGRGKGYYDRFLYELAKARSDAGRDSPLLTTIGFGYEAQLVDKVPMDERDRRLDGLALG